jgi:hypothetical protein
VQESIVSAFPKSDMTIAVVWTNALPFDGDKAARKTAAIISDDQRVRHFYDPDNQVGKAVARSLRWDDPAWDIYLFYDKGVRWQGSAPPPVAFAHQLGSHMDDGHFHCGEDLTHVLRDTMVRVVGAKPVGGP